MTMRQWWRRMWHRGTHRPGAPRPVESPHAVAAAVRAEQAKLAEARDRANEAERFLREFRNTFGLNGGRGAHR